MSFVQGCQVFSEHQQYRRVYVGTNNFDDGKALGAQLLYRFIANDEKPAHN